MRDSDLIRKFIKAGMSYRNIANVIKCSHGSISAERRSIKKEEAELKKKQQEQAEQDKKMKEFTVHFSEVIQPLASNQDPIKD